MLTYDTLIKTLTNYNDETLLLPGGAMKVIRVHRIHKESFAAVLARPAPAASMPTSARDSVTPARLGAPLTARPRDVFRQP